MKPTLRGLRRSILPVRNARATIGTATTVAPGLALTALHVIAGEDPDGLRLGYGHGLAVRSTETLPLADYLDLHDAAHRSQQRNKQLTGQDTAAVDSQTGRHPSTVSRELRRNAATRGGKLDYRASVAQWKAELMARRPKTASPSSVWSTKVVGDLAGDLHAHHWRFVRGDCRGPVGLIGH